MTPDPLLLPLGSLAHPVAHVDSTFSLYHAARLLRGSRMGMVAFVHAGKLTGCVTESSLARALAQGATYEDSIERALEPPPCVLEAGQTGAEALRKLAEGARIVLVVSDDWPVGTVCASDLLAGPLPDVQPPFLGGMATPFGVYLTTGSVGAGVGPLGLVASGALLFALFLVGSIAAALLAPMFGGAPWLYDTIAVAVFLILLRLMPLAGTHAAEHKVVHAIERGEPLTPEVVKRMPRVHPRCGTNLAAAASLFVGLASAPIFTDLEPRLLLAGAVTLFAWRPLGNALQRWITTRPPNALQVASGIRAGKQIMERVRTSNRRPPTVLQRIYYSGLPHVVIGSTLTYWVARGIAMLLGIELGL